MIITNEIAQQLGLTQNQVIELNKFLAFINVKSVSDLLTVMNPTNGHIPYEDGDGNLKKIPINIFFQLIGGLAKPVLPDDPTPTVEGWYKPRVYSADPGTNYPNHGNLKAIEGFDTLFYFDGTVWIDIVNKMPQNNFPNKIFQKSEKTAVSVTLGNGYINPTNGTVVSSNNWIRSSKITGVSGDAYQIEGALISQFISENKRVHFFSGTSGTTYMPAETLDLNFTNFRFIMPANATAFYINVAADTAGLNPIPTNITNNFKIFKEIGNNIQSVVAESVTGTLKTEQIINIETKINENLLKVNYVYAVLSGTSPTKNASGWYKACAVVADKDSQNRTIGCTGFGIDRIRDLFLVSEYGYAFSSRLLIFRRSDLKDRSTGVVSTPYKAFDLTQYVDEVQGCTHDYIADHYLVCGIKKGTGNQTQNHVILRLTPNGNLLEISDVPDVAGFQPGQIVLDPNGNLLYKVNNAEAMFILNRKNFKLIDIKQSTINIEGIACNPYTGEKWFANESGVIRKRSADMSTQLAEYTYNTFSNETGGTNVEGMAIDKDGSLILCADTFLHGGTALGNALFFFDFENTVNKKLYFEISPYISGGFVTSIEKVNNVSSVVVNANFTPKLQYRSGTTAVILSNAAFSTTISNSTFLQVLVSK